MLACMGRSSCERGGDRCAVCCVLIGFFFLIKRHAAVSHHSKHPKQFRPQLFDVGAVHRGHAVVTNSDAIK